ncbi:MAG TPA: hypothetical protein VMV02_04915 [Acidimicrobiales bacterium]|nr:hypothetical protein [Acidimicrobiales bacterium]
MSTTAFLAALDAAVPGAGADPRRLDGLDAFAFVSEVVAPAYLDALRAAAAGAPGAADRVERLSAAVEAGFAGDEDGLVDALAMRLVERYLCRDAALLAVARPHLGPATLGVVTKLGHLISEADRSVAARREAASGR